jgi:NAD-dependent dihydropyrimidine dehydrogenase PreA subunit
MKNMTYLKDVVTLQLDENKCTGCGMCLEVCPHEVFKITGMNPEASLGASNPPLRGIVQLTDSDSLRYRNQNFTMNSSHAVIQTRDACMECGACSRNCPVDAISVASGVGCAAAVINSMLGRKSSECSCSIEPINSKVKQGGCCC